MWTLDELLSAGTALGILSPKTIEERYSRVGGIPRIVYAADVTSYEAFLSKQRKIVNCLSSMDAHQIVTRVIEDTEDMSSTQPKSALMGYMVEEGDESFERKLPVLVSHFVETLIIGKYMVGWWNETMKDEQGGGISF